VSLPLGPKVDLQDLLDRAQAQGRHALAARLVAALAYIEELEARLDAIDERRRRAGVARAESLTPERRREIATIAGRIRQGASPTDAGILPL
jgi:hypothetical protein